MGDLGTPLHLLCPPLDDTFPYGLHPTLQALMDNPSLAFVRPRWIYSCNEKQKLLPHQLYGVVPQA